MPTIRKICSWTLLSLLFVFSSLRADDVQKVTDKIISHDTSHADLSGINSANRSQVIAYARSIIDGGFGPRILLLRLGDEPTIQDTIERYRPYDTSDAKDMAFIIARSPQPLLVPWLASDLYLPDDQFPPHATHSGFCTEVSFGRRWDSAVLIVEVLKDSSEFSPELRAWATIFQRQRFAGKEVFIEPLKRWWEQNADKFKNHDYESVKPPQAPPSK
jgi:hypothetical protein